MITLGAKNYGIYGFAFSVVFCFSTFVDFGFNLSATKEIASKPVEEHNRIFTAVLLAKTFFLLLSLVLNTIAFSFFDRLYDYRIAVLLFTPLVISNAYTFFWYFQGIGKIRTISIINTISKIIVLPLTFVFVRDREDVNVAIIVQSSVYILSCLISNIYLLRKSCLKFAKIGYHDLKQQVQNSFPLFLSSASSTVYTQLFTVILGITSTKEVVGCYSSAERIMRSICLMLHNPINQAFFPKIVKLAASNIKNAIKSFKILFIVTLVLMVSETICLLGFTDIIVIFLGKDEYTYLSSIIRIISIVPIAVGCGSVSSILGLLAIGDEKSKKHYRNIYIITAPISLLVVAILSYLWGVYGVSISLIITEYSIMIAILMLLRKTMKRLY